MMDDLGSLAAPGRAGEEGRWRWLHPWAWLSGFGWRGARREADVVLDVRVRGAGLHLVTSARVIPSTYVYSSAEA